MEPLIFKTNIKTKRKAMVLDSIFEEKDAISKWSVDTLDIDKILRIEVNGQIKGDDIIYKVNLCGFQCEELTD